MKELKDLETGLYRRNFFDEELERLSKKRGTDFGIIVASAESGDHDVIIQMADTIKKSVRDYDIVARLDKNEFGVILEDVSEDMVIKIAKRISEDIKSHFKNLPNPPKVSIVWNLSKSFFGDLQKAYESLREQKP